MGAWQSYRLRMQRRRWLFRAYRKRRELRPLANRTNAIQQDDILLFCTQRNEQVRLPYFLSYYRDLGVNHFLFVDNGSTDGSSEFLADQADVSVWRTTASYKGARFGMDWLTWLKMKYAHGHWALVVDSDEFFVYPYCDTRPLRALTDWLDVSSIRSFSAMLLDMYPKGRLTDHPYEAGRDPIEIAGWFDSGNYTLKKDKTYGNLWIQGGPRSRMFFASEPERAPALNKIPLVKWDRRYAYASATHMLLPRGLNLVYDETGGEKASGVLLHAKFLDNFSEKASEELTRKQHFYGSVEYRAYLDKLEDGAGPWNEWSEKYINWRQIEILGLMSKGNWA